LAGLFEALARGAVAQDEVSYCAHKSRRARHPKLNARYLED